MKICFSDVPIHFLAPLLPHSGEREVPQPIREYREHTGQIEIKVQFWKIIILIHYSFQSLIRCKLTIWAVAICIVPSPSAGVFRITHCESDIPQRDLWRVKIKVIYGTRRHCRREVQARTKAQQACIISPEDKKKERRKRQRRVAKF